MIRATAFVALLCAGNLAVGEEKPWPTLELGVSGYLASNGSDLRLDSELGDRGSDLDLEDRLDLEDDLTEVRVDLRLRFLPRHRLDFAYYDLSRDGDSVTNEVLRIGEREFDVAVSLQTQLDFKVYKLAYAFSFIHNDTTDIAVSLGAHAMDVEFSATGRLLGSLEVQTESADEVFPLPVVGLHLAQRLGDRFTLSLNGEYFALEIDDVDGSLVDLGASLEWKLAKNIGLSIGYNWVDFDVDSKNDAFPGRVQYDYSAVVVGAKLYL